MLCGGSTGLSHWLTATWEIKLLIVSISSLLYYYYKSFKSVAIIVMSSLFANKLRADRIWGMLAIVQFRILFIMSAVKKCRD